MAQGPDYHDIVKRRLKALARFMPRPVPGELKVFFDTAPVHEKPLAARAVHRLAGQGKPISSRANSARGLFLG